MPSVRLEEIQQVAEAIQLHLDLGFDIHKTKPKKTKGKTCYICRFNIVVAHRLYHSLCDPCGEFNISSSSLSLPPNLSLTGKFGVVTGGRINLGFRTALRLLRCGAHVIVSTRYPMDAERRYLDESDSLTWKGRLKIVGADFRTAKDVFGLVDAIKSCLTGWGGQYLDILINNAAQTLTDPLKKEEECIRREILLLEDGDSGLVSDTRYVPRVRGGQVGNYLEGGATSSRLLKSADDRPSSTGVLAKESSKTSWTQTISDIPYEDVISAHSINALVPFILLRELFPLMHRSKGTSKPASYVINVSSREGLPERTPSHSAKSGMHVHTNMSKAALHMITETEAGTAWKNGRIAINSVDPGFMSADPVWMKKVGREGQEMPIGWEDGAGRVLWPIARGEKEGIAVWGRFLKHFREVEARRW